MIIRDAEITMAGPYSFTANAAHVRIKQRSKVKWKGWEDVFWPSPVGKVGPLDKSSGEWYGPEHKRIVDALNELEKAIIAAAEGMNQTANT